MSIYCTGHELKLPVYVACADSDKEAVQCHPDGATTPVLERWIEVYFQHVPNHINEENGYDWEWLPAFQHKDECVRSEYPYWFTRSDPTYPFIAKPVDEGTPGAEMRVEHSCSCGDRAVFVIDEDHFEKDGQRYLNPLLVMTGLTYETSPFSELMGVVSRALEARFGVSRETA